MLGNAVYMLRAWEGDVESYALRPLRLGVRVRLEGLLKETVTIALLHTVWTQL